MLMRCVLLGTLLVGCGSQVGASLTTDEARWCDATEPSAILEAAVGLGRRPSPGRRWNASEAGG